ncbi:MAG: histidine kinase [Gammaproteobacteria bacterium CG22_combo_CG10-13_8_21_14_all_40_8]|nr:MAG: histidine kinase [Gammaproteobacteria bacterium CG22_combo_CG10-13_8_21_14_all_40_8]
MAINITPAEKMIIDSVSIPPRPEALLKVADEAKKEEPSIPVIAKAISSDISLSAAVLQVVNSAAFRRMREVESIDQAVILLGLKRIIPLVKAVALKGSMTQSAKLSNFWQSCEAIAAASVAVAKELRKPALIDHAYMLGLFHAAGVPIMFQNYRDYGGFLELAERDGWDNYLEEEIKRYQTSHSTIGAILAEKWMLPQEMINVIYYLHEADGLYTSGEMDAESLDLLSILKIARNVVHFMEYGDYESQEWENIREPLQDYLDLSDSDLDEIRVKVIEAVNLHKEEH